MPRNLTNNFLTSALAGLFITIGLPASATDLVDLPRNLEIELALSALPEGLQDGAAIYLRDPKKGFVLHRKGTNGFATFVARTSTRFYAANWKYEYPKDQLIPVAFDKIGVEHHAVPFFDLERMRVEGVPPEQAKQTLRKRFRDGTYKAPPKGGLSYMFAPIHRAYGAPAESADMITVSFPHHMPYAPHVVTQHLGSMDPHGRAGTLDHGGHDTGPHGYMYFMVPQDEADRIRAKYASLLDSLCKLHDKWCLPGASPSK